MTEEMFQPEAIDLEEVRHDRALRPERLDDFIGQRTVVENLKIYIDAARKRREALDHILLSGMPGLGKTTLAHIVARELGCEIRATAGPVLDKAKDLVGILTEMSEGGVLFIDEVHRLNKAVEEYLYAAMEDFTIDIIIDQGPNARTIKLGLKPFTLIGATTREGLLTGPFLARFGVVEKLDLYPADDLVTIIRRSARILGVAIDPDAERLLAGRSRGTPRYANRFLRRIRDVAQHRMKERIDRDVVLEGLDRMGVDERGLNRTDRRILQVVIDNGGGPVGLKTIAVSIGEEERTIEEVYEPYLIRQGYLVKTPRGRKATEKAVRDYALPWTA